jgi:glucose/arabinose dehydrogenase
MNRTLSVAFVALLAAAPAMGAEPDNLVLPSGFHATVVAENVGPIRHMAVRGNDIYVSTRHGATAPSVGIIAIRMGADHKAAETKQIPGIDQGTGIEIYKGYLYAASGTGISRIRLDDNLVPAGQPEVIVEGLTATNHPIAFDGRGNMYVGIDGGGGTANCPDPNGPKDKPKGLMPCPLMETRGGVWRFSDSTPGQKFADGERFATGVRNMSAMDWRSGDGLYGAWHGRDGTSKGWPELVTQEQDDAIPDEMFKITRGTDMGWPYTYWDSARKIRLGAPEYGGDGKTAITDSKYAKPVAVFAPLRPAVLDLAFYNGTKFPTRYRGGAFLAMHGGSDPGAVPGGRAGYNIMFVPFSGNRAGTPVAFAEGFAETPKNIKTAAYRPVGVAVGGDGALYVAETNKGKIWRIAYGE